jgi:excisionase family DNA binding protein
MNSIASQYASKYLSEANPFGDPDMADRIADPAPSTGATPHGPADLVADGFASIEEASEFLTLSRAYVYRLMDAGDLPYAKFGRARRIPRRALREYAEKCMVAG